eukprot:ANDGO_06474.mRNA.1 NEDD8-activating enzyme E1 regulatory subunit
MSSTQKYDRQLRLWGDHGQSRLERSSVLVLGATAVGTEFLKNLVLPNIGSFTVVDGSLITERDCGNNFFVTVDSIGQPRAEIVTKLLRELNPSVKGSYVHAPLSDFLSRCDLCDVLSQFSAVVVATFLSKTALLSLDQQLSALRIPLLIIRSFGVFSSLRIVAQGHLVVESRTEKQIEHLRIADGFPQLNALVGAVADSIAQMDSEQHAHIPYPVILAIALANWKAEKQTDKPPATYSEKTEFKEMFVRALRRSHDEANFEEAERFAHAAFFTADAVLRDPNFQTLVSYSECTSAFSTMMSQGLTSASGGSRSFGRIGSIGTALDAKLSMNLSSSSQSTAGVSNPTSTASGSLPFSSPTGSSGKAISAVDKERAQIWAVVAAISEFVKETRSLPLLGKVPDMTADTLQYVALQEAYRAKQKSDLAHIQSILAQNLGGSSADQDDQSVAGIPIDLIEQVVSNATALRLVHCRTLREEYEKPATSEVIAALQQLESGHCGVFYPIFRAFEAFHEKHGVFPSDMEGDAAEVLVLIHQMFPDIAEVPLDLVKECCRGATSEIHNIAAVMGGVASQEFLKIVTFQRIPLCNTFIYNGASGSGSVIKL